MIEICRVCGCKENLKHISEGGAELINQLRTCVGIHIDFSDALPQHICEECEFGLSVSSQLRYKGQETEKRLHLEFAKQDEIIEDSTVDKLVDGEVVEEYSIDVITENLEITPVETNPKKESSFVCVTCQHTFTVQSEYRQHIKRHGDRRFNCIQCNSWFPTLSRLRRHEKCHCLDLKLHMCTYCSRVYRDQANLTRHIQAAHDQQRRYKCTLCTQSFGRSDVLRQHLVSHMVEKKYECLICEAKFKTPRYLDNHMKVHEISPSTTKKDIKQQASTTTKTYTCPHCGKVSTRLFTHKNHLLTHSNVKPFVCTICSKGFRTKAALQTHKRIHDDSRPYPCSQCSMSFRQSSHLKDHLRIHEGVLPYECNDCDAKFAKKSNLTVHKLVHSGEKPFKCLHCIKRFSKPLLLKRHMLTIHGITAMENEHQQKSNEVGDLPSYDGKAVKLGISELEDTKCTSLSSVNCGSEVQEIVETLDDENYFRDFVN